MSGAQTIRRVVRIILPIGVLLLGVFVASDLMRSSPRARRKPKERSARLVEVQPVKLTTERARVHAMGTVRAARAVELRPEVSGKIVRIGKELLPGDQLTGADYQEDRIVCDGNIITSRGPGTAMDFALALVEELRDAEAADGLRKGMLVGA